MKVLNVLVVSTFAVLGLSCSFEAEISELSSIDEPLAIEILGPVPLKGNSETVFEWSIQYSGIKPIKLKSIDINLLSNGVTGCSLALEGTGRSRSVKVTGCQGAGDIAIKLQKEHEIGNRGVKVAYPVTDVIAEVSDAIPKVKVLPNPGAIRFSEGPASFYWRVEYEEATQILLKSSDIQVTGPSQGCQVSVAEGLANSQSRVISLTHCAQSAGDIGIALPRGTAINDYGGQAPALPEGVAETVPLLNGVHVSFDLVSDVIEVPYGNSQHNIKVKLNEKIANDVEVQYVLNPLTTISSNITKGSVVIAAGQTEAIIPVIFSRDPADRNSKVFQLAIQGVQSETKGVYIRETVAHRFIPGDNAFDKSFQQISVGWSGACGLEQGTNKLFCWGANYSGDVGDGTTTTQLNPIAVDASTEYESVGMGQGYSCGLLKYTGQVKCWGTAARPYELAPFFVNDPGEFYSRITVGYNHACGLIKDSHRVKCWGVNSYGSLGVGNDFAHVTSPMYVGTEEYSSVAAGMYRTCALTRASGQLHCWGSNSSNSLGQPSHISSEEFPTVIDSGSTYKAVALGQYFSCGILTDGGLKCWGENSPTVGDGTYAGTYTPIRIDIGTKYSQLVVGSWHTCGKLEGTERWKCWGKSGNLYGDMLKMYNPSPTLIKYSRIYDQLSFGNQMFGCGLVKDSGKLHCWGSDHLGDGGRAMFTVGSINIDPQNEYEMISRNYASGSACALTKEGEALCWGGSASFVDEVISPVKVDPGVVYATVSAGGSFSCGIVAQTQRLRCWGNNSYGQLGIGSASLGQILPARDVEDTDTYSKISVGYQHACGILTDGRLKCWGRNDKAQLGLTVLTPQLVPFFAHVGATYLEIVAGVSETCGILQDQRIVCWGNGLATKTYPGISTDKFDSVTIGGAHKCAIANDTKRVKCWGRNRSSSLGRAGLTDGQVVNTATYVDDLTTYKSIKALNDNGVCGLKMNGDVQCWGSAHYLFDAPFYGTVTPVLVDSVRKYDSIAVGVGSLCGIAAGTSNIFCRGYSDVATGHGRLRTYKTMPLKQ